MTRIMSSSEAAEAAAAAEVAAAEAVGVSDGGGVVREVDPHVTELPDSFQDSVVRMGKCTLQALNEVSFCAGRVGHQHFDGLDCFHDRTVLRLDDQRV